MGYYINILLVKSQNKVVETAKKTRKLRFLPAVHGTIRRQFEKLSRKLSSEIQCNLRKILRTFSKKFFESIVMVEIWIAEDKQFRNATCRNIEKQIYRKYIGEISKTFSYLIAISLQINLIKFLRLG